MVRIVCYLLLFDVVMYYALWPAWLYLNKIWVRIQQWVGINYSVELTQLLTPHIMPTLNFMSMEDMSLPRLSVSIPMIGRILLLVLNIIVIGIIGYYFAYYRGSFRQNLFDEELMMLVCAVSAFINTVIMVMVAMASSYHQSGSSLQTSYAELISNGVSAFLLIIAGMVLLIQVALHNCFYFWGMFSFRPISDVYTRQIFRGSLRGQGVQWSVGPR